MKEFDCQCSDQLVELARELNIVRLELARIQERLNRVLILCQNSYTQFTWDGDDRRELKNGRVQNKIDS